MTSLLTKDDVLKAYKTLKSVVTQTPLQHSAYLSKKYGANIYLKREDLQIVRSFKLRGAYYAMSQLTEDQLSKGVVCASAGNHAQGVAYTAAHLDIHAAIFMPVTAPTQKINQVKYFGGDNIEIHLVGDTFDECNRQAHIYAEERDSYFVEPFNDLNVMAGQGTLAVEIHQDLVAEGEQADYVLAAIGGGGLISGVSTYVKGAMQDAKVIGVESLGAPSMVTSIRNDEITIIENMDTFCDGTSVAQVGHIAFDIVKDNVDDFIIVDEGLVASTILDMYTRQAIIAEPSGALTVAALEEIKDDIKGKTVVCIISGGNNDIKRLANIEERALLYEGIKHYFIVNFPQRAGALKEFVNDILSPGDDITTFQYTKKSNQNSGPLLIGINLEDPSTINDLKARLTKFDPKHISLNENATLRNLLV